MGEIQELKELIEKRKEEQAKLIGQKIYGFRITSNERASTKNGKKYIRIHARKTVNKMPHTIYLNLDEVYDEETARECIANYCRENGLEELLKK